MTVKGNGFRSYPKTRPVRVYSRQRPAWRPGRNAGRSLEGNRDETGSHAAREIRALSHSRSDSSIIQACARLEPSEGAARA